jgi:hypothetical protein
MLKSLRTTYFIPYLERKKQRRKYETKKRNKEESKKLKR